MQGTQLRQTSEDGGHEERTSWGPGRKQRVRSGRQGVLGVPAPEVHDMRPAGPAASSVEQQPRTEDWGCAVVFIYFHAGDNLLRSLRPRWLTLPPPVPKWESLAGGLLGRPSAAPPSVLPASGCPTGADTHLSPQLCSLPCTPGLGDLPYHLAVSQPSRTSCALKGTRHPWFSNLFLPHSPHPSGGHTTCSHPQRGLLNSFIPLHPHRILHQSLLTSPSKPLPHPSSFLHIQCYLTTFLPYCHLTGLLLSRLLTTPPS